MNTNKDEIQKYIIKKIEAIHALPNNIDYNTFNYIKSGHIDSIAIIRYILEIECYFDIQLNDDMLDNKHFHTISGATDIIYDRILEK